MMMIKSFNSQFHANCLVSRNLQSNNVRNHDSITIIIIVVSGNNTYNGGMQRVPQSLSITLRRWFNGVYPNYLSTLLYNKSRDQLPRTDLPIKLRIHKSCCRRRRILVFVACANLTQPPRHRPWLYILLFSTNNNSLFNHWTPIIIIIIIVMI